MTIRTVFLIKRTSRSTSMTKTFSKTPQVPSFVEEDEEEDTLFDKKKTNERATDDINISEKTPNATLKVQKPHPSEAREINRASSPLY